MVDWKAYPHYTEKAPLPNFELAPGLYNVNAIEMAASAIEVRSVVRQIWKFSAMWSFVVLYLGS